MLDIRVHAGDSGEPAGGDLLEAVGLVSSHREGRERIWRVRPEPLTDASDCLTGLSKRWDRVMERLRAFVEDPV